MGKNSTSEQYFYNTGVIRQYPINSAYILKDNGHALGYGKTSVPEYNNVDQQQHVHSKIINQYKYSMPGVTEKQYII